MRENGRCSTATTVGPRAGATIVVHDEGVVVEPDRTHAFSHLGLVKRRDIHDEGSATGGLPRPMELPVRRSVFRRGTNADPPQRPGRQGRGGLTSVPSALARQMSPPSQP